MVLCCAVPGCRRNSREDLGHSFFGLPKDAKTRENWLRFIDGRDGHSHVRICTDHFDPQMIRKRFPRPLLVRNAVPTIHKNLNGSPDTKRQSRKLMIVEDTPATLQQDRSLNGSTGTKRQSRRLMIAEDTPATLQRDRSLNGITNTKQQSRRLMIVEDTPAPLQRDRSSSPPTEVINVHANNISQIIISNEHRKLVVNIIDPQKSDDCTLDGIKIESES